VKPEGPFEPDDAELENWEIYGVEPHIPDMDFESEVYYKWVGNMQGLEF
jgi:hypothetical protein